MEMSFKTFNFDKLFYLCLVAFYRQFFSPKTFHFFFETFPRPAIFTSDTAIDKRHFTWYKVKNSFN